MHHRQCLYLRLLVLLLASCGDTIYRGTWEPATASDQRTPPRLLVAALRVIRHEDLETLRGAGAYLIGWHSTTKGWALRAGSTGGTHFFPTEQGAPSSSTTCMPLFGTVFCSSSTDPGRWTRVAVLRLEPNRWRQLPPHLIPPEGDIVVHRAAAARTDCTVQRAWGTVVCDNDWRVVAPWVGSN